MLRDLILLLPFLVCIFWGITFLCRIKKNYKAQNILTLNLFVTGIGFYVIARSFDFDGDCVLRYREDLVFSFVGLLSYPLNMLYFKYISDNRKPGWGEYLIFLPALLIGGSTLVCYGMMGEEGAGRYAREILYNQNPFSEPEGLLFQVQYRVGVQLFNAMVFLQAVITIFYALIYLKRWRKKLDEFYSELEGKSVKENYIILISIIGGAVTTLCLVWLGRDFFTSFLRLVCIFIPYAICFYVQAYVAYHLKYATEDLSRLITQIDEEVGREVCAGTEVCEVTDAGTSGPDKNKFPIGLCSEFEVLIKKDRIFLQSDIRLDDVVRMMRTNRTYISRLINEKYQCSFSDLINNYRIEYAQELLLCNSGLSQKEVAIQVGFLHVSSFNRTFKRLTGMTPGEWSKLQKNSDWRGL